MKLIVGLGNPEDKYIGTRHNLGFEVIDAFAKKIDVKLNSNGFGGIFYMNQDFILAKPQTYMNKSGDFVQKIANYYKIKPENILVVYDDLDTELGKVKLKISGSSGGHRGMQSIIDNMNSQDINRIKIGIGRPKKNEKIDISTYVLSSFEPHEVEVIAVVINKTVNAISSSIYNGFRNVMNNFNNNERKK